MAENKFNSTNQQSKIEQPKTVDVTVKRVEDNAAILKIDGWSMRVYFDNSLSKTDKEKVTTGRVLKVQYLGDLKDVHSIKLLPLKSVD